MNPKISKDHPTEESKVAAYDESKNSTDNNSVMLSFKFPFNAGIMSKKNDENESNVEILPNRKSQFQANKFQNCKSPYSQKIIGERIIKT